MNFDEFETAGVYSKTFADYAERVGASSAIFDKYRDDMSLLIKKNKTYSDLLLDISMKNIIPPSITEITDDKKDVSIEEIIKSIEEYDTISASYEKLSKEIKEKEELVNKMKTVFKISRPLTKNEIWSFTALDEYSLKSALTPEFIQRVKEHITQDEIKELVEKYVAHRNAYFVANSEHKLNVEDELRNVSQNFNYLFETLKRYDILTLYNTLSNKKYMNDVEKMVCNLEEEIGEKTKESTILANSRDSLRTLIKDNEIKIYKHTVDNMKLFIGLLKIKEGSAYNEKKLVDEVNKIITTPVEVIFKSQLQKSDPTENGYSIVEYAAYDNDPVPVSKELSGTCTPFNNNSRIFMKKSNDLREIKKESMELRLETF